ncbi:hypothetical protein GGX14DRAFT_610611 [Mycena pura]|uniref:F-box domain-containing protein n=1 Tax=Mycena pura TaxID=153505 RepID=A0AAD6UKG3_9AGAR|nr:hypothetical protein GGX14DRAFT_610611 [Mycena pura]
MSPAPSLLNLAPEVILAVFAHCDVSSVVSAGQTCRWLNQLAFDKCIWVALCRDLQRRAILDSVSTPELADLSTRELIALVKRLVHGPETWTPRDAGPIITAEVRMQITLHSVGCAAGNQLKPLGSGRYVLLRTSTILECWDTVASRLVWRHKPSVGDGSARVRTFAAEEIFAEESLVVLICVRTYPAPYGDQKNYLEVVEVNLRKGTHKLLMVGRAPDTQHNEPFHEPAIDGNIAAISIKISPNTKSTYILLLVNYETGSSILLECPPSRMPTGRIVLIPRYIILKLRASKEHDEIRVVAHAALQPFWRKAVDVGGEQIAPSLHAHQLPAVSVLDAGPCLDTLSILASPVRSHEYRVWAHSLIDTGTLFSYQLSVRPGEAPQWRVRAPTPVATHLIFNIPYSGHLLNHRRGGEIIIPPMTSNRGDWGEYLPARYATVGIADAQGVGIAHHSGALIYGTRSSTIVVMYYK